MSREELHAHMTQFHCRTSSDAFAGEACEGTSRTSGNLPSRHHHILPSFSSGRSWSPAEFTCLNSPLPDSHSVVRHEITLQGLHLFNMDMIREHGTEDVYYVIDINYFPGKWNSSRVGFSSPIRSLIRAVSFVSFTSTQATGRCPITSMYSPTFCRASGTTRRDLQLSRKHASQSRGLRIQSPRGYGWPGGLNYLVSQANKYEFDTRYWPWIDIPFCWWTSCCRRRVHWQPPQFSSCS